MNEKPKNNLFASFKLAVDNQLTHLMVRDELSIEMLSQRTSLAVSTIQAFLDKEQPDAKLSTFDVILTSMETTFSQFFSAEFFEDNDKASLLAPEVK